MRNGMVVFGIPVNWRTQNLKSKFSWWWGLGVVILFPLLSCVHGTPVIDPTQLCSQCTILTDPVQRSACQESFCPAPTGTPIVIPSPTVQPTSVPSPTLTSTPSVSPSPTLIPSVDPTPYPVTGTCVDITAHPGHFITQIRQAMSDVKTTHPELFVAGHVPPRIQPTLHYKFDQEIVKDLALQGIDSVIDGNCGPQGCDELDLAFPGNTEFYEAYAVLVSSGDYRDPVYGGGYVAYCTPRGFPLTSAPVTTPTPVPTQVASLTPPSLEVVNGTGRFTLFFWCVGPECTNRSWPCDQDHAGWVPGEPFGPLSPDATPQQKRMYGICQGRVWDVTCGSINNTFVKTLTGDVHGVQSGRNCYTETIVGSGTWQACIGPNAKTCIDPNDYRDDTGASTQTYSPTGSCAHGEVQLVNHEVCSPTYTN